MKTVYRVEHREHGYGPYIDNDMDTHHPIDGLHDAHQRSNVHPGPRGDSDLSWDFVGGTHRFGFASRKQLDKWFKGFKRKLHEAGFVIRVFEAPDETTVIGERQAIFIKEEAKLVATLPVVRR